MLEVVLFFAPILGRGGTAIPPDLVLAAVMCVVTPIFAHPLVVVLVYPCNTHLIVPEVGKSKEALGSKVRWPHPGKEFHVCIHGCMHVSVLCFALLASRRQPWGMK